MKSSILLVLLLCGLTTWASVPDMLKTTTYRVGYGSGAVVENPFNHKKYILTNWHVCINQSNTPIEVATSNGFSFQSKEIYSDPKADLCILGVKNTGLPSLKLGKQLKIGDKVHNRGFPGGKLKESSGILEAFDTFVYNFVFSGITECPEGFNALYTPVRALYSCTHTYQTGITTLYARPGASGSPVVDNWGNLVGVLQTWHMDPNGGVGHGGIVLLDTVRQFFQDITEIGL